MGIIRRVARFFCSTAVVIVGIYTAIALAVAVFIATGKLVPGEIMFYDSNTPTLWQTLLFVGAGSVATAGLALARHKLSAPRPR